MICLPRTSRGYFGVSALAIAALLTGCSTNMMAMEATCDEYVGTLDVGAGPEDLVVHQDSDTTILLTATARAGGMGRAGSMLTTIDLFGDTGDVTAEKALDGALGLTGQTADDPYIDYAFSGGIARHRPGAEDDVVVVVEEDRFINDLWRVDGDRFIASHPPSRIQSLKYLLLGLPVASDSSKILLCEEGRCTEQNDAPLFANGVIGFAWMDKTVVLVADYFGGNLHAFTLDPADAESKTGTSTLTPICTIAVQDRLSDGRAATVALDNLSLHDGQLFIAAQHDTRGVFRHLIVPSLSSGPGSLYAVKLDAFKNILDKRIAAGMCPSLKAGKPPLDIVVRDDGTHVRGLSTGIRVRDKAYLGQIRAEGIPSFKCGSSGEI